jgi:hypothetical protein
MQKPLNYLVILERFLFNKVRKDKMRTSLRTDRNNKSILMKHLRNHNIRRLCKPFNFALTIFQSPLFSKLSGSVISNAPASCGQKLSRLGKTPAWKKVLIFPKAHKLFVDPDACYSSYSKLRLYRKTYKNWY